MFLFLLQFSAAPDSSVPRKSLADFAAGVQGVSPREVSATSMDLCKSIFILRGAQIFPSPNYLLTIDVCF